ncbi:type II secretion system protein [Candidatus Collierbacteria bacterium]|nr:type II secretion system protein [Candidatus Collierbacteria bacterium]
MNKKNSKAFTLLELLVVIGIVAVLVSLAAVSYNAAQQRSRDARRRSDLKAIQGALEQYYGASVNSYSYPGSAANCMSEIPDYLSSSLPVDPSDGSNYTYSCTSSSYCICDQLEVSNTGNALDTNCNSGSWGTGTNYVYYCVANLQ